MNRPILRSRRDDVDVEHPVPLLVRMVLDGADSVHADQSAAVEVQQWGGVVAVNLLAASDDFFGVVGSAAAA